jgi:DNA phosphorothioation-dependent restriction protein DptH
LVNNQIVPIIFSYHEDIDDRLASRVGNMNFVDYNGLGFNPMKVTRPNPSAFIDNASMVRDIFSSIFPDLGDLQLEYLRSAVKDSYTSLGWGRNVEAGERPPAPTFQAVYDALENSCPDKKLLMRLRELNDYGFFSGAGSESTVLDATALTLVRIHLTQNESLQRAFSSFILHNIYQSMFARGEQRFFTHAIVIDEAHRASRLKLLPTLAKECRKYGIFLIIASQEARDFNVSLFSAVGNYLVLRVTDQDAKALADQCVPSQARSKTIDRLKQLSKYHGIFFGVEQPRPEYLKLKS